MKRVFIDISGKCVDWIDTKNLGGMCEDSADNKQGDVLAPQPEQQARGSIDALLETAGWHVCDASAANIHAARGVVIREFPLPGYGFADYLLYVAGKVAGVSKPRKRASIEN